MWAQQRREARLSRRRERERRNRALESAEEREAWSLARRRVRDRARRAAQSTAQREEALQRRRERFTRETSEESAVISPDSDDTQCVRCRHDKHVPKVYSSNNMNPGPVPPELQVC